MFGFFKKNITEQPDNFEFPITTDLHSHILPGIDDGSPDIETSLRLIKGLSSLGIKHIIATPHIIGDLYRNTPETIRGALKIVQEVLNTANIPVEVSVAAEYMMDDYFMKLVAEQVELLTLFDNRILTEQSYTAPTSNLNEIAFELLTEGYKPVMAHPERYFYYHKNYDEYNHIKDMGFLLQVNLLSLTGYYGKNVKAAAKFILENNLADFVATDIHHHRHLEMLSDKENIKLFNRYIGEKKYNLI